MKLASFLQGMKVKRHLRMIDESPVPLRSSYEHGVLMEFLKKAGQRRKKHRFEEFAKRMDQE